jgi:putative ABC transport system permease protein
VAAPSIDPRVAAAGLREALGRVSDSVASESVGTVEDHLAAQLAAPLVIVRLLGVVALVALALAFFGVYAAIGHSCTQRLTELGVRMAIGAAPLRLALLALQRDGPLVVAGIGAGAGAMLWVTRVVWRELLWLGAADPVTWFVVSGTIVLAAMPAAFGPARRAAHVDPAVLLRAE